MARRRKGRAIDGMVLLDKPAGVSSNHALQRVKYLYGAAKAGHTGALDPLATGMLPICLGEATKFSQFLLDADKRYQTTAKLGIRTDSSDADGKVVETKPVGDYSVAQIESLLAEHFSGEIEQVPSMFSALKHNGQPLYKLARQGIKVEVKRRRVTIYSIELLAFRPEACEMDLQVHCSKGTYIRSIVEDLGLMLGCGAHVKVLRRLDAGPYQAPMMRTLAEIEAIAGVSADEKVTEAEKQCDLNALDALLLPAWTAVDHLPRVAIDAEQQVRIGYGQSIPFDHAEAEQILIFTQSENDARFLGLGQISDQGVLKPLRLIQTAPD
ncbi:MAG: tRNA pseudouridine(55) synthase TruB [Halopseudomonas sp.]